MDVSTFTQLIGSLGFPVAACIALFWKMNKQDEQHSEEISKMTTAIENNTIALIKLNEKLESDK